MCITLHSFQLASGASLLSWFFEALPNGRPPTHSPTRLAAAEPGELAASGSPLGPHNLNIPRVEGIDAARKSAIPSIEVLHIPPPAAAASLAHAADDAAVEAYLARVESGEAHPQGRSLRDSALDLLSALLGLGAPVFAAFTVAYDRARALYRQAYGLYLHVRARLDGSRVKLLDFLFAITHPFGHRRRR